MWFYDRKNAYFDPRNFTSLGLSLGSVEVGGRM